MDAGPLHRFTILTDEGPVLAHNCTQALARDVITEKLDLAAEKWPVWMQVHDELVACVPEAQAQACHDDMQAIMRAPISWWPEVPLDAEGGIGDNYKEAK